MSLGSLIKEKRKSLSMTQKELAEGICVQAMISKIENDDLKPSKEKLQQIADRLEVSIDYFSQNTLTKEETDHVTIQQIMDKITEYSIKREDDSINFIMRAYEDEIQRVTNPREIMFFQRVKAVMYEHTTGDSETAIKRLKSITLSEEEKEMSLEVINSIASLYIVREEYDNTVKEIEKVIHYTKDTSVNFKVISKLLLNYSIGLSQRKKFKKMLDVLNEGIELLVRNQSLFLLGDFYYQKGWLFREINEYQESLHYYENAYSLFDVQSNERLRNLSKIELSEVRELMNHKTEREIDNEEET